MRNGGKPDLAARYEAALGRVDAAIDHHRRLIEQGADEAAVSAARDDQDDAIEELQRIDADVDTYFEKGGL